jgi:NAD(P)-dependent dehydrogenase (short-subunit alcohol dehydrogenase family)
MALPVASCPADWPSAAPDLYGRVVVITGASGGLGQAIARQAAAAGAEVVLVGRKVVAMERLYDDIEAAGGKAALYPLNLGGANPDDYAEFAASVVGQCGGIDALVFASAHLRGLCGVERSPVDDWLAALHINLSAPFLMTQACLPHLQARPDAAVVFTVNGPEATSGAYWGGYGVAQAGLAQFAAVLHDETDTGAVRVHALDPGPMRTALRQRVWFSEDPSTVPTPDRAARAVTALLGSEGAAWRGRLLRL